MVAWDHSCSWPESDVLESRLWHKLFERPPSRYQLNPCKPTSSNSDEGCWEMLFLQWLNDPRPLDSEAALRYRDVIGRTRIGPLHLMTWKHQNIVSEFATSF